MKLLTRDEFLGLSDTVIEDLFEYALDLNYNATDFENKVFSD